MGTYYYKRSEPQLWTVGSDDGRGKWTPESDHGSPEAAAQRVIELNGGRPARAADVQTDILGTLHDIYAVLEEIRGTLEHIRDHPPGE